MESYEEFCSRLRTEHGDLLHQQASLQCTMSSIQFYGRPILTPLLNEDQSREMTWYRHQVAQREAERLNKKTCTCLFKSQDRSSPLSHEDCPKQANNQSQGCLCKDEQSGPLLTEVQKESTLLARIQEILDSVQLPGVLEDLDDEPCSSLPSSSLQEQVETFSGNRRTSQPVPGSVDKTDEAAEAEEGSFSDRGSMVRQNQRQTQNYNSRLQHEKQPQRGSDEKNHADSPHNSQSHGVSHRDYIAYTHFSTPPSTPSSNTYSAKSHFNCSASNFTVDGNAATFSSPSHNSAESRCCTESPFPDSLLGSMTYSLTGSYARLPSPKGSLLSRCEASSVPCIISHLPNTSLSPSPHTSQSLNRMSTLCSLASPISQSFPPYSTPAPFSSASILISCPVSAAELSPRPNQTEDLLEEPTGPSLPTPVSTTPPQCPVMSSPPRVSWHYSSYVSSSTVAFDQQGSLRSSTAPGPDTALYSPEVPSGGLSVPGGELSPAPLKQDKERRRSPGPCPSSPTRAVLNRSYDVVDPVLSGLRPHVTTERHSSPAMSPSSQAQVASRPVAPELTSPNRGRSGQGVEVTCSSLVSRGTFRCNNRSLDLSQHFAAEGLQRQISVLEEMRRCLEEQHSLQLSLLLSQQQRELQRLSQVANPKLQKSFCRLGAVAKGFLTRRLLKTEKVKNLRKTVQDSREFISLIQDRGPLSPQDCTLRERVSAQLHGALCDVHEVFHRLDVTERLLLIQQDRELCTERKLRDMNKSRSPACRRVTLSAATQKSLERKRQRMKETLRQGKPTNHRTKNRSTDRILQPNQDENARVVSSCRNLVSASGKEEKRKRQVIQRKPKKI